MTEVKQFENNQLDWWCNYYRTSLTDLASRTRQYLNGELQRGVLEAFVNAIENEAKGREKLA